MSSNHLPVSFFLASRKAIFAVNPCESPPCWGTRSSASLSITGHCTSCCARSFESGSGFTSKSQRSKSYISPPKITCLTSGILPCFIDFVWFCHKFLKKCCDNTFSVSFYMCFWFRHWCHVPKFILIRIHVHQFLNFQISLLRTSRFNKQNLEQEIHCEFQVFKDKARNYIYQSSSDIFIMEVNHLNHFTKCHSPQPQLLELVQHSIFSYFFTKKMPGAFGKICRESCSGSWCLSSRDGFSLGDGCSR